MAIPEGIVKIYSSAFSSNEITSLSLPASLTKISGAFFDIDTLREIHFAGTLEQWNSFDLFISRMLRGREHVKVFCSDGTTEVKFD